MPMLDQNNVDGVSISCGFQGVGSALPQFGTQVNDKLPQEPSVITAAPTL